MEKITQNVGRKMKIDERKEGVIKGRTGKTKIEMKTKEDVERGRGMKVGQGNAKGGQ